MKEESILEKYLSFGSDKESEKLKAYFNKYKLLVKLDYLDIFKKLSFEQIESLHFNCSFCKRGNERDRFYKNETIIYKMCKNIVLKKKSLFSDIIKNISIKAYNKKYHFITLLLIEFEKRINQIEIRYKNNIDAVKKYLRLTDHMVKRDELFFNQDNLDYERVALEHLPLNIFNHFKFQLLLDSNYDIVKGSKKIESAFLLSGNMLDNQDIIYKLNSHFRYCVQKGVDFFDIANIPKSQSYSELVKVILLTTVLVDEKSNLFKKILHDLSEFKNSLPD